MPDTHTTCDAEAGRTAALSDAAPAAWYPTLVAATASSTIAMLPVFLLGAAAPTLRGALALGPGQLGIVVSAFWVTMAAVGLRSGRFAQSIGARRAIRTGTLLAVAALGGMATTTAWWELAVFAALGGLSSALVVPAGDMALLGVLPVQMRGLAYGIKQAALPLASVIAGVCVPSLVLTIGWRWAFGVVTVIAVPVLASMRGAQATTGAWRRQSREDEEGGWTRHRVLLDLAPATVAITLAMAAVSAMGGFFVESATARATSADTAGLLLAIGGGFGICGRFVFSWLLGAAARPYRIVCVLLCGGGAGSVIFASSGSSTALVVGTFVAFGLGWGWNGLLTQTVVASHPEAPARASAYLLVGSGIGGVAGPLLFGTIVGHLGYTAAWTACAAGFFAAAIVLGSARPERR